MEQLGGMCPFKIREGVSEAALSSIEGVVGELPKDLHFFYKVTNGLRYEWFNLLPLEDPTSIKETWDGLKRANNLETTKFFGRNPELLKRFLIFAEISGGHCACVDRQDGSIWFQDAEGIHQTNLTLSEFLETTLREVAEL